LVKLSKKEGVPNMPRGKNYAWQVVDNLDRLKIDFVDSFIRHGEPRGEEAKNLMEEFTADLKKLVSRCERMTQEMTRTGRRRGRGDQEEGRGKTQATAS
jgi:hypothetical protein